MNTFYKNNVPVYSVNLSLCDQILFFCDQIDLKNADPDRVEKQIEKMFDIPAEECIRVSMSCDLRNNVMLYDNECFFVSVTMFSSRVLKCLSLDFCKIRHKCGPRSSRGSEENTCVSFHQILFHSNFDLVIWRI